MSAAYGSYMASSSNLRYQILAGLIEERGIEVMFKSNPAACAVLSFIVRCVYGLQGWMVVSTTAGACQPLPTVHYASTRHATEEAPSLAAQVRHPVRCAQTQDIS